MVKKQNSFFSHYEDVWHKFNKEQANNLFFPKLSVEDAKEVRKIRNYGRQDKAEHLWFSKPNLVQYQERLKITSYCSFNFETYPFDFHECRLKFCSSTLSSSYIKLLPLTISHNKMSTENGKKYLLSENSPEPFDIYLSGVIPFDKPDNGYNYSCTGVQMDFFRKNLATVIGSYFVPTCTFSLFSLLSYSVEPNMVPGRLGLLVTLDLIFANVYNAIKAPESRGFSYIEIWMVGMQIPIIVAILEYALLLTMKRFMKPTTTKLIEVQQANILDLQKPPNTFDDFSKRLDKWTMIVCCLYIVLFTAIYWVVVLSQFRSRVHDEYY